MHKDRGPNSTPPFRPIVSSIGTYNYNLAKYLCNLLSPHIPTEHCATDTFTFVQDIQPLSMFGKFMVSFDVESLFTNIPLEECIDLAVNYISEGDPDLKLSKSDLRSLFTVATAQTHFLFKDVRANCFCASLLRTRITCHVMPRHASSARAKY